MKISIIGCGKMGGCIAERLAGDHKLTLFDRNRERTQQLAQKLKATYCQSAPEAISGAEIIILAVKPQDLDDITKLIHREIYKDQLLVSTLAGITRQTLLECFAEIPVLRMMPNLAVRHGKGVVGFEESEDLSKKLKEKVEKAFANLGFLHWAPENKFDALTALTGSGPAFLFVIMESIIDAAIAMGFPLDEARNLSLQLLRSSLAMLEESDKHPGALKWEVTSPAGTTIAGIRVMEDCGVRSGIINTFLATYERSKSLGPDCSQNLS
jgi:pyrroline-5-carboxylate reductase